MHVFFRTSAQITKPCICFCPGHISDFNHYLFVYFRAFRVLEAIFVKYIAWINIQLQGMRKQILKKINKKISKIKKNMKHFCFPGRRNAGKDCVVQQTTATVQKSPRKVCTPAYTSDSNEDAMMINRFYNKTLVLKGDFFRNLFLKTSFRSLFLFENFQELVLSWKLVSGACSWLQLCFRNKLLTEESLREDSLEEENYIPEVEIILSLRNLSSSSWSWSWSWSSS